MAEPRDQEPTPLPVPEAVEIVTCPVCERPVTDPPCSLGSDGGHHLGHPHWGGAPPEA